MAIFEVVLERTVVMYTTLVVETDTAEEAKAAAFAALRGEDSGAILVSEDQGREIAVELQDDAKETDKWTIDRSDPSNPQVRKTPPKGFTTLDDFLEEFKISDEVTAAAEQQLKSYRQQCSDFFDIVAPMVVSEFKVDADMEFIYLTRRMVMCGKDIALNMPHPSPSLSANEKQLVEKTAKLFDSQNMPEAIEDAFYISELAADKLKDVNVQVEITSAEVKPEEETPYVLLSEVSFGDILVAVAVPGIAHNEEFDVEYYLGKLCIHDSDVLYLDDIAALSPQKDRLLGFVKK